MPRTLTAAGLSGETKKTEIMKKLTLKEIDEQLDYSEIDIFLSKNPTFKKVREQGNSVTVKNKENDTFCVRLSPENQIIEIETLYHGSVSGSESLLGYDNQNYNHSEYMFLNEENIFKKFGITEIPKPLPLPEELKILLNRKTKAEFFDYESSEWVHTHFYEYYEERVRLFGGDENGAIYIEPSTKGKRILFIGRGDMACYYYLDL